MRLNCVRYFLFILVALVSQGQLNGQTLQVDRLKANYLVNFADFVLWNGNEKTELITIAILENDELEFELEKISKQPHANREFNVVSLDGLNENTLEQVDIIFAGAGREKIWKTLKERCNGKNILLVGDDRDFLDDGGAIQFTFRKNRLRFYVDQENANTMGIQLSSKLIELAAERPE